MVILQLGDRQRNGNGNGERPGGGGSPHQPLTYSSFTARLAHCSWISARPTWFILLLVSPAVALSLKAEPKIVEKIFCAPMSREFTGSKRTRSFAEKSLAKWLRENDPVVVGKTVKPMAGYSNRLLACQIKGLIT